MTGATIVITDASAADSILSAALLFSAFVHLFVLLKSSGYLRCVVRTRVCVYILKFWFISLAQSGSTALIFAALCDHFECVRILLDAGADTEAKDTVRQ